MPSARQYIGISNMHLQIGTKTSFYLAVVVTILLHASESWVLYYHHLWRLEQCLHTIFNIYWSNFNTNTEVLVQAKTISIEALLLKSQLCWVGHFAWMQDHRPQKVVLYGVLSWNIGGPEKRYRTAERSVHCKNRSVYLTLIRTSGLEVTSHLRKGCVCLLKEKTRKRKKKHNTTQIQCKQQNICFPAVVAVVPVRQE